MPASSGGKEYTVKKKMQTLELVIMLLLLFFVMSNLLYRGYSLRHELFILSCVENLPVSGYFQNLHLAAF